MSINLKVKLRRTKAVFIKQLKDMRKNKMMLVQFLLFPIMALVLTFFIGEREGIPKGYFALMFAPMFAGMMPMMTMATIIGEEKEKKNLKILTMNGVRPFEYLFGVSGFILLMSVVASVIFGLTAKLGAVELLLFLLVMLLGVIASLIVGSAAGLLSKNQMNATAIVMPFTLLTAFVPMIAVFNEGVKNVSNILYTQQISNLINDISTSNFTFMKFLIIVLNIVFFAALFFVAYKKGKIEE